MEWKRIAGVFLVANGCGRTPPLQSRNGTAAVPDCLSWQLNSATMVASQEDRHAVDLVARAGNVKENSPSEEDRLVLTAIQTGRDAFEPLHNLLQAPLCAFLLSQGASNDVEDAIQSAWQSAWQSLERFDPGERPWVNFRAFMFRVARNKLISIQRKRRDSSVPEDADFEGSENSPDTEMIMSESRKIDRADLAECLSRLGEEQREAFLYRHRASLAVKEVAVRLDVPEGTVLSRCSRAREMLRQCIEGKRAARGDC